MLSAICFSKHFVTKIPFIFGYSNMSTLKKKEKKVAFILSGCGVYDGTEIHEASACLVHLSRFDAQVSMFAPNIDQMHVIDHTKGEPVNETRNVLVESARIARGNVQDLNILKSHEFDAVVLPGGFGAAKNLSNFAIENDKMTVNNDVGRVIKEFREANKPIALCCIAPVLAAKLLPGCELTVGMDRDDSGKWPYSATAAAIQSMGAKHINKDVTESHVDVEKKIVTTPAFMCNAELHQIYDGIGEMIANLMKLVSPGE